MTTSQQQARRASAWRAAPAARASRSRGCRAGRRAADAVVSRPKPTSPMPRRSQRVQHQHRPGARPGDVEGDDHQRQRAHRPVAAPASAGPRRCPGGRGCRRARARRPWASRPARPAARRARRRRPGRRTARPCPAANRNAPIGGPDELVDGDEAGHDPGVGDAEVALVDQHRQQRAGGGVGEDLGRPEQEHRDQHQPDVHVAGDDGAHEHGQHDRPRSQVHDDHHQPPVEPVGDARRRTARRAATAAAASTAASATRIGSRVCEATSSGPAASAGRRRCC